MAKRAITPVIAVILLIVMTISISAFAFNWIRDFFKQTSQQAESRMQSFKIVAFEMPAAGFTANTTAYIYISNIGDTTMNVSNAVITLTAFVKNTDTIAFTATQQAINLGITDTVAPGEVKFITFTSTNLDSRFYKDNLANYDFKLTVVYGTDKAEYTITES